MIRFQKILSHPTKLLIKATDLVVGLGRKDEFLKVMIRYSFMGPNWVAQYTHKLKAYVWKKNMIL